MTQASVQARPKVMVEAFASSVRSKPLSSTNDVGAVELADLSRFEGEGGREAPGADVIEALPDALFGSARARPESVDDQRN